MFLISPISLPSSLPSVLILLEAVAIQDGRDMGELTGGIKGGMKSSETL
jgi:hypothetical protein